MVNHIIDKAADSQIVKDQLADSATNVFTGKSFVEEADAEASSFDMSSLFTIDGNKLQAAFQIDPRCALGRHELARSVGHHEQPSRRARD